MTEPTNAHPRTPERLDYERRYAKRFRRHLLRMDADRGEVADELMEKHNLSAQSLLNTLMLGWTRTSDEARHVLADQLATGTPETVSFAVARALEHLADEATTTE